MDAHGKTHCFFFSFFGASNKNQERLCSEKKHKTPAASALSIKELLAYESHEPHNMRKFFMSTLKSLNYLIGKLFNVIIRLRNYILNKIISITISL